MRYGMMVSGLVGVLGGCVDGGAPAPAPTDEPAIERTIVTLMPDGSEQVTTRQVSAAQQRQELIDRAARRDGAAQLSQDTGEVEQGLASVDGSCAGSSMWIFDSDNNQRGTGLLSHEICFFKSSTAFPVCADLRQYNRLCFIGGGCQTWASNSGNWIGSYWAGQDQGMYLDVNGAVQQGFGPYFRQDNAQLTVPQAVYLCFPN